MSKKYIGLSKELEKTFGHKVSPVKLEKLFGKPKFSYKKLGKLIESSPTV